MCYFKVYAVGAAWKDICFIYKDIYDVVHDVTADAACDLTWLHRRSLEYHIKGIQHVCIITNCCSSLHGPAVVSHQERLYLSGAKDNNARETLDGEPQGDGGRADEGKDTYVWERKGKKGKSDRVMEEILLKVMNVSLSFLLYDPGAFANYPDSQRYGPALRSTREKLGSSAKCWPCYKIHQGHWLQLKILTF